MIVTINHPEKSGATLDFMFQNQFHIMRKFNEAIDEIRRNEVKQLNREGLMEI